MKNRKIAFAMIFVLVLTIFMGMSYRLNNGMAVDIHNVSVETIVACFLFIWIAYSWEMNNKTYTSGMVLIALAFLADALDEFEWVFYTDVVEMIIEDYVLVLGLVLTSIGVFRGYKKKQRELTEVSEIAYKDHLTNLYSREGFSEAFERMLVDTPKVALLSVDYDNFRMINDVYGHDFGDKLLREIGRGLDQVVPTDSIIGRIAADEFLCAVPIREEEEYKVIVQAIISSFDEVYTLDDIKIHMTTSIGVALYPQHGTGLEQLSKKVNLALAYVKENGKNSYKLYDETIEKQYEEELIMKVQLLSAFEKNEIYVQYQPIVNVATGAIECYEALCRWELDGQLIPPDDFIPVAEKYGVIQKIDYFILEQVCRSMSKMDVSEEAYPHISFNLSPLSLVEKELTKHIETIVSRYDIPFENISFEITETAVINNILDTIEKVNRLFDLGFSVKLDDFGTGYSSLTHLKGLPVTTLKIDKTFIDTIDKDEKSKTFIGGLIGFLHSIGVTMVAEGVETKEQYEILKTFDCTMIQGYYFSKPYGFERVEENCIRK